MKSNSTWKIWAWCLITLFPVFSLAQVTADFSGTPLAGCSPLVVQFTDLSTGPVTTWSWDFGNGNTSTLQNPAAVYVTPGTYTVTLTVTGGGFNDSEVRNAYITVFQNPTAALTNSTPRNGCAPLTVCFSDISTPGSGAINGWLWDFGDGNTSTVQNPCHTYGAAGTFTVSLVVTDVNGCNNTVVMMNYVSVSQPPTAAFTGAPLSACTPPLNVTFTNTSSGGAGPLSYQWDFGDGGTSTANGPTHAYTASGTYTVTLIATDVNGCADTLIRSAYINISTVTAAFTPSTTTICEGQSVTFTDNSTGGPTAWQWNFGDGGTSTAQNPTYTYATAGTYTVTLIASNGGCTDTITQTALITVDPSPVANFVADTTQSCEVPLTVNFTDLSTGGPTTWAWDFGDGGTSTAQNPSHTYTAPGNYTVTLTVTGPNGCTDVATFVNYIQIVEPVADFVGVPLMGCIPLPVNFTDLSTSLYPIVSWEWDFGDGNTSTAQNPSNTYTVAGAFTVSLIIVNSVGCTDTLIRPVYIQAGTPPVACFTVNPTVACVDDPINFTDCSTNATGWFWDFGDGGTSNAQNPTYAYQDTGCFTVTLIASNFGCTDDTIIQNVVCITPPLALFNLNPATACSAPLLVTFTDNSILPHTWLWDFGDGNTSTLQNPTHNYIALGTYIVTLTVSDTVNGCTDDEQAVVTITDPVADFTGGPLFGCGPLTVNFTDQSTGATTWAWDFGDGGTSNAQNPTYTYQNPGTYTVTLTIGDNNGCTDVHVEVNFVQVIGPAVDFLGAPLAGCDSVLVNFTDLTVPGAPIVSWLWDFGDGSTSNLQNPSHMYLPGTWDVSLTVTDNVGCFRTFIRNNYIVVTDPVAGFTINDTITCAGVALNFTNTSTGAGLSYSWDFGDGGTSTAQNPSHTYAANGNYTVTLAIQDNNGCQDTVVMPSLVTISDVLAGFSANPTNASCPPLLVSFTDTSFWDIVSWQWDFGDATGSTLQNPSHVYATAGSYDVSLSVVNDDGCMDTLLVPGLINILGPNGSFTFDPDTGCTPQLVHFEATATNTATYTWDFGDGNVAITTVDSVDHVYTQTGTFFPILILDDGLGCTYSILSPDSIVIDTIPLVNFAVNSNVFCGLDSVRFTDLTVSTRPIVSWFWDFGDGFTDSVQNPVHFYAAPGNYTVTLAVVNSLGCTDTVSLPANVSVFLPPTADFIPSDTIGCDPLFVSFTDASIGPQPITAWDWTFGNGNTSTVQNPTQTFVGAGGYTVTLIAIDSAGCRDTVSRNIVVSPTPVANFTANDSLGCPGMLVTFTGDTTGGIVLFEWDFGDGSPVQTGNPISHAYNTTGNFTVTLIVENAAGCRDTLTRPQYIRIFPPTADFLQSATSGCPPLAVTFTSLSTGLYPFVSLDWDFGDGTTGTGTPVSHTYATPGVYTVTLIVTDSLGCTDTLEKPNLITVFEPPVANFGITDTLNCDPFTIQLTDSSTSAVSTITAWAWDFGDGGTSAVQHPSHAYLNLGTYTITLIVTDGNGCQDTTSLPFTVPVRPQANFTADDSAGCAPFPVTFTADSVDVAAYFWTFGDGGSSNVGPVVTYNYGQSGFYTVTLVIQDIYGCSDTLTRPSYIFVDSLVAAFITDVGAGCPPLPVTFTDQSSSDTTIVSWFWDFGDGQTSTVQNPVHIYLNPGQYTIVLTVTNAIGCTDTFMLPNFVIYNIDPPGVPPLLMVTVESDISDSISWMASTEPDFDHYVLWWEQPVASGIWVPVDSFFNRLDTTYTHLGINTLNNSYCYRLQVVDICGYRSSLDSSQRHCTINLEASPGLDQAILNWNAYIGWDSVDAYDVYRVMNYDTLQAQYLGTVPGSVLTYIDSAVVCYEEYCYRVRARELGGFGERSWSDTSCALPIHVPNPLPIFICSASVLNDTFVELNWTLPPNSNAQMLFLDRSLDGQNWTSLAQLVPTNTYYVDTDVSVHSQSYYYRISMIDSCGDVGPYSNIGRTILLEADLQQGLPFLDWNAYEQWPTGVQSYGIELFNDLTQAWQPVTSMPGGVTEFLDAQSNLDQPIYCYRLFGHENGGGCRSLSNTDCVPVGPTLFAPNAFTPNGDGINEFFELKGHFVAEYHFMLFDRWGAMIFESFDLGYHWDGTWRKKPCQEGVFVWRATAKGFDGTEIEKSGSCTLIR